MELRTRLRAVVDGLRGGTVSPDAERSHLDPIRTDGGKRRDGDESADEAVDGKDANETDETDTNETDANGMTEKDGNETAQTEAEAETSVDASNVEVTEAGEAEPAEPKWDRVDPDDIPEFEIRADQPAGVGGSAGNASADERKPMADDGATDPTAGRPNTARSPDQSRIKRGGTEGYIVALELCARLPDDVRLPEEAADLVPAAVEAELEEDIQAFAAAEFETTSPSVETLSFVEVDDKIWMRLRLGISPEAFADLDPEEIREHALQQLEGLF